MPDMPIHKPNDDRTPFGSTMTGYLLATVREGTEMMPDHVFALIWDKEVAVRIAQELNLSDNDCVLIETEIEYPS